MTGIVRVTIELPVDCRSSHEYLDALLRAMADHAARGDQTGATAIGDLIAVLGTSPLLYRDALSKVACVYDDGGPKR